MHEAPKLDQVKKAGVALDATFEKHPELEEQTLKLGIGVFHGETDYPGMYPWYKEAGIKADEVLNGSKTGYNFNGRDDFLQSQRELLLHHVDGSPSVESAPSFAGM